MAEHNPYSALLIPSAERLRDEEQFEERVVKYILERHGLGNTRTRFILMDIHEEARSKTSVDLAAISGLPPHLVSEALREANTIRKFVSCETLAQLFPEYPINLRVRLLHKTQHQRLTVPKMFSSFTSTSLCRLFEEERTRLGTEPPVITIRPFGLVYRWPKVKLEDNLVAHTLFPVNERICGSHLLVRISDDCKVMIEPLSVLIDGIIDRDPEHRWMKSATRAGFRDPVSKKADQKNRDA